MRKLVAPTLLALATFVLLMPMACTGGEGDPTRRCETLAGWELPGFTYSSGGTEIGIYLLPLASAVVVFVAVRWLLTRRAPA